jgi:putative transposase
VQAATSWSTLKTELLSHGDAFDSLKEACLEVAYYLDTYFNFDFGRRRSTPGYRSPHQVELDLLQNLL